jgi:ABC-type dipeptide/oligopeptide/nickel transport system permease subunit
MNTGGTVDRILLRMCVLFRLLPLMMLAVSIRVISGMFCYHNLRTVILLLSLALQPSAGYGLLVHEVS